MRAARRRPYRHRPDSQFAPLEQLRHGFDPLHHAEAVIALAECREHVFELDALADRIGSTPSSPPPVTKRISRRSLTSRMPSPLSLRACPHAPRGEEVDGEFEDVAAAMSSTATTATWATGRSRSAAHKRSICATASSESIPSGFET